MSCSCINLTHKRRCEKKATVRCDSCGDYLCGGCAVNHHAHREHTRLPKEAT